MRYFDVGRHWTRRVAPHLTDPAVASVLVRDFRKYTRRPFLPGMKPADFESCDWRLDRPGRHPRFWDYVCSGACHWLVNFNLRLAERAAPDRPWRILMSEKHSTVFDGDCVVFDLNFLALGIPPAECVRDARGAELPPGVERRVGRRC